MNADALLTELADAQRVGDLGPAPLESHLEHAQRLAMALGPVHETFVDLGTGAGVPGLILLLAWPESSAEFLDASTARIARLQDRIIRLGLASRAHATAEPAEVAGRGVMREASRLVIARAFGAPAVTAECAAPLLAVGGRLLVSEPPDVDPSRWPVEGLATLGMLRRADVAGWAVLEKVEPLTTRFPRRTGVPRRKPLW